MSKRKRRNVVRERKQNPTPQLITTNRTLVDILILVHRRFDLVAQCLDAIPEAMGDLSYKIIVLDNGSPLEEADTFYASRKDEHLKVYRNTENLGFPRGCNVAFQQGSSPLVFFLNSDVILKPGSVPLLVKQMDDPKVGAVGMKLLFPEYTDLQQDTKVRPAGKIQHIGLASDIHGDFQHLFIGWTSDHPKVNAMHDVYAVTGAALMTRRFLFKKAGMFYEGYGLGSWEDLDFCLTVRKMGYSIIVVPEAVGIHHTGATASTYKLGFPLQNNKMVFMQRWAQDLDWTAWVYL